MIIFVSSSVNSNLYSHPKTESQVLRNSLIGGFSLLGSFLIYKKFGKKIKEYFSNEKIKR